MVKKSEGVKCKCGTFTPFGVWVFAHMNIPLLFTCPDCGTKYTGCARTGHFEEDRNKDTKGVSK